MREGDIRSGHLSLSNILIRVVDKLMSNFHVNIVNLHQKAKFVISYSRLLFLIRNMIFRLFP